MERYSINALLREQERTNKQLQQQLEKLQQQEIQREQQRWQQSTQYGGGFPQHLEQYTYPIHYYGYQHSSRGWQYPPPSFTSTTVPLSIGNNTLTSIAGYQSFGQTALPQVNELYTENHRNKRQRTTIMNNTIPISKTIIYEYTGKESIPKDAVRVYFHSSVTEVKEKAFHGCSKLKEVVLNNGLEKYWQACI